MTSSKGSKASVEDEIVAHERDLQDLLGRVLEVPMKPYLESLRGYDQSLARMERRLGILEEEFPGKIRDGLDDVSVMLKGEIRKFESALDERIDHSLVAGKALALLQASVQRLQWTVVTLSVLLVLAVALCGWAVYQGA